MDSIVDEVAAIAQRLLESPSDGDRALGDELVTLLQRRKHSWYHDGIASNTKTGYNRICQKCGFREQPLGTTPCTGDRTLRDSAQNAGAALGRRAERDRMRTLLGL